MKMHLNHSFFFFFAVFVVGLVSAQQSINGIPLPRESVETQSSSIVANRRDLDSNGLPAPPKNATTFQWPRIDGPPEDFPAIEKLGTAYWTFNLTFIKHMVHVNKTDSTKATKLAFQAAVEYEYKWLEECWKLSNHSASIHNRTNTVARVVAFPYMDQSTNIDPQYQLAPSIKVACWEREADGDINTPTANHTKKLIKKLHWDRQTAQRKIRKMHKHLKPINPSPSKSNKKHKKGKKHLKHRKQRKHKKGKKKNY